MLAFRLALVLSLATISTASAQVGPEVDLSAGAPPAQPGTGRYFLAHSIPFDGQPPRPIRDIREVSEDSIIVEETWFRNRYPSATAEFEAGNRVTRNLCYTNGAHLSEAEELVRLFSMLVPIFEGQFRELEELRPQIGRNTWWRRLFGLIGTVIAGTASGGAYAGVVGAGFIGNEGSATTNDRTTDLNVRITQANVLVTLVNIRSQLLQLNVMGDYLILVDEACGAMGMRQTT